MKQTDNKIVTGEGAVHTRRQRLLKIGLPILVALVLLSAGAGWYLLAHKASKLTPQQQAAKNTISDQQQFIQQENQANVPDDTKANSYANLAVTYAVAGQCKEARDALKQAEAFAPTSMRQDMKDTANTVNEHC